MVTVTDRNDNASEMCRCCLEPIDVGEWLERGPCGHPMHTKCVLMWAMHTEYVIPRPPGQPPPQPSCPYCRATIYTFDDINRTDAKEEMLRLAGSGFWKNGRVYKDEAMSRVEPPPPDDEFDVYITGNPTRVRVVPVAVTRCGRRALVAMSYCIRYRNDRMPWPRILPASSPRRFLVAVMRDAVSLLGAMLLIDAMSDDPYGGL